MRTHFIKNSIQCKINVSLLLNCSNILMQAMAFKETMVLISDYYSSAQENLAGCIVAINGYPCCAEMTVVTPKGNIETNK